MASLPWGDPGSLGDCPAPWLPCGKGQSSGAGDAPQQHGWMKGREAALPSCRGLPRATLLSSVWPSRTAGGTSILLRASLPLASSQASPAPRSPVGIKILRMPGLCPSPAPCLSCPQGHACEQRCPPEPGSSAIPAHTSRWHPAAPWGLAPFFLSLTQHPSLPALLFLALRARHASCGRKCRC